MNSKLNILLLCALLTCVSLVPGADAAPPTASKPAPAARPSSGNAETKKAYSPQSTVAAKTAFASVPANSPVVKNSLDAKSMADAQKLIGKSGAFQGTVSKVYVPRGNGIVVLDFAPDYHSALTAVVKPAAYAKFPDLIRLEGKHVLISGKFISFHNAPEMELTALTQVKVIR